MYAGARSMKGTVQAQLREGYEAVKGVGIRINKSRGTKLIKARYERSMGGTNQLVHFERGTNQLRGVRMVHMKESLSVCKQLHLRINYMGVRTDSAGDTNQFRGGS